MQIKPGVYLVDKPTAVTSHDVVAYFRRESGIKRVGHAGTLDPLATGLLIILVGRDFTKQQSQYLKQDKEYLLEAQIGLETDTYDSEGTVVKEASFSDLDLLDENQVRIALEPFRGQIDQFVPAFSAVKVAGQKLYHQARRGEVIAHLPCRSVLIKKLDLLEFNKNSNQKTLTLKMLVACSSGTYIRSLVHDLGQELKNQAGLSLGATVTSLRRLKIGELDLSTAIKLSRQDIKPWAFNVTKDGAN